MAGAGIKLMALILMNFNTPTWAERLIPIPNNPESQG